MKKVSKRCVMIATMLLMGCGLTGVYKRAIKIKKEKIEFSDAYLHSRIRDVANDYDEMIKTRGLSERFFIEKYTGCGHPMTIKDVKDLIDSWTTDEKYYEETVFSHVILLGMNRKNWI